MSALQVPPDAATDEDPAYVRRLDRLVALSRDGHDAYDDVDWDGLTLDPEDPRLRAWSFDPLSRTRWYLALSPARQSEVGLLRVAVNLRTGWEFENLLQQGLLARALRMRNTNASFRYLHTEVMEESQHTLMFYEFVRRHAAHARGMPRGLLRLADPVTYGVVRTTPTFFYFMVLGGELPVDHLQRLALKEDLHPLVERIMRIHVEEEARHVSFASEEIRRGVPAMTSAQHRALALAIPPLLGVMARLMVHVSPWMVQELEIPKKDLRDAFGDADGRQLLADSVARIRRLCAELDLLTPQAVRLWQRFGIWDEPRARTSASSAG